MDNMGFQNPIPASPSDAEGSSPSIITNGGVRQMNHPQINTSNLSHQQLNNTSQGISSRTPRSRAVGSEADDAIPRGSNTLHFQGPRSGSHTSTPSPSRSQSSLSRCDELSNDQQQQQYHDSTIGNNNDIHNSSIVQQCNENNNNNNQNNNNNTSDTSNNDNNNRLLPQGTPDLDKHTSISSTSQDYPSVSYKHGQSNHREQVQHNDNDNDNDNDDDDDSIGSGVTQSYFDDNDELSSFDSGRIAARHDNAVACDDMEEDDNDNDNNDNYGHYKTKKNEHLAVTTNNNMSLRTIGTAPSHGNNNSPQLFNPNDGSNATADMNNVSNSNNHNNNNNTNDNNNISSINQINLLKPSQSSGELLSANIMSTPQVSANVFAVMSPTSVIPPSAEEHGYSSEQYQALFAAKETTTTPTPTAAATATATSQRKTKNKNHTQKQQQQTKIKNDIPQGFTLGTTPNYYKSNPRIIPPTNEIPGLATRGILIHEAEKPLILSQEYNYTTNQPLQSFPPLYVFGEDTNNLINAGASHTTGFLPPQQQLAPKGLSDEEKGDLFRTRYPNHFSALQQQMKKIQQSDAPQDQSLLPIPSNNPNAQPHNPHIAISVPHITYKAYEGNSVFLCPQSRQKKYQEQPLVDPPRSFLCWGKKSREPIAPLMGCGEHEPPRYDRYGKPKIQKKVVRHPEINNTNNTDVQDHNTRWVRGPEWYYVLRSSLLILSPAIFFLPTVGADINEVSGPWAWIIGILLTILALTTLLVTSFTNPGILPRNSVKFTLALHDCDLPTTATTTANTNTAQYPTNLKYCYTCHIFRPKRAVHCGVCNNCVLNFDHHCPHVGQCIGAGNYHLFIWFLWSLIFSICFIMGSSIYSLYAVPHSRFNDFAQNPNNIKWKTMSDAFGDYAKSRPFAFILIAYCLIAMGLIAVLWGLHMLLSLQNITTNEYLKQAWKKGKTGSNPYARHPIINWFTTLWPNDMQSIYNVNFYRYAMVSDILLEDKKRADYITKQNPHEIQKEHQNRLKTYLTQCNNDSVLAHKQLELDLLIESVKGTFATNTKEEQMKKLLKVKQLTQVFKKCWENHIHKEDAKLNKGKGPEAVHVNNGTLSQNATIGINQVNAWLKESLLEPQFDGLSCRQERFDDQTDVELIARGVKFVDVWE